MFISQLKSDDPHHSEAETIANSLQKGEIQAETSVLTLLETAAFASRLYYYTSKEENQNERKVFVAKILKMLTDLHIKFIHTTGDSQLALGNIQVRMPNLFNESILLSLQTTLRTLDLMHVAAARHAKQMNQELGAFVTGDTEFIRKKDQLSRIIGIPILSPKEYVASLGLR